MKAKPTSLDKNNAEASNDSPYSVVIPAHNAATTIEASIRSVQAQHLKPQHIVVVADRCDDDSASIAAHAGAEVLSISEGSAAIARNRGIRSSAAPWIALLDADDCWHPTWLSAVETLRLQKPEVHVFYGAAETAFDTLTVPPPPLPGATVPQNFSEKLLRNCFLTTSAMVFSREAFEGVRGFDEGFAAAGVEDYDLWLRLAEHYSFAPVAGTHVTYHRRGQGSTSDLQGMLAMREQTLEVLERAFARRETKLPNRRRALANAHRLSAQRLIAHDHSLLSLRDLLSAVRYSPGNPQLWGLALAAMSPRKLRHLLRDSRRRLRKGWRTRSYSQQ